MDLVKIGFLIQTSGLEKANKEVDSLLDKTGKIGTVSKKSATEVESSQKKAKKATEETTKAVEKNTKAVEKGNKEADKAKKAVERTTQALEKQKIVGEYLAKGLDKSTANSLANFKQLKASVVDTDSMFTLLGDNSALNKANKQARAVAESLNKMKLNLDLVGKGFSASEQAQIRQLKANGANNAELEKAIELIKKRKQAEVLADYQNNKASLSREWMSAYDKEIEARVAKEKEAAAKIQQVRDTVNSYEARSKRSFGGGILDQVEAENKGILELRKKYTDEAKRAADKEAAEEEARRVKTMQARQKEHQQSMSLLEKERNKIKQANAERERALLIEEKRSQYVAQGYGKGDAKKLATLEVAGADPDYLERYKKSLVATTTALGSFGAASTKASNSHSGLMSQIKGIAFYAVLSTAIYATITALTDLAVSIVATADEMSNLTQRLSIYLPANIKVNQVLERMGEIAKENRVTLADTGKLFTQLLPPIQRIKGGVAETTAIVDAFGKAMLIGGANTMEAASATIQFGQAMASGKLAGDEFRSLAEASPRLLQAIADGAGIAAQKLKEMSSAGKLTSGLVSAALLDQFIQLEYEAAKMGQTVSGAFNEGMVAYQLFVNKFNEQTGFTTSIVESIRSVVKSLEGFGKGFLESLKDGDSTLNSYLHTWEIIWDLVKAVVGGFVDVVGWILKAGEKTGLWKATFDTVGAAVIAIVDTLVKIPFVIVDIGTRIAELVLKPFEKFIELAQKGLDLAGFDNAAARLGQGLANYRGFMGDIKGTTGEVITGVNLLSLGVKDTANSTGDVKNILDKLKQQNKDLVIQEKEKKAMTDSQYISEYAKLLLQQEGVVVNAENLNLVKKELEERFKITQEQSKQLKLAGEAQAKKDEAEAKAKKAIEEAKKAAEQEQKRLQGIRDSYEEQIQYVLRLQNLLMNGVKPAVAKIAAEKEYTEAIVGTETAIRAAEAQRQLSMTNYNMSLDEETELLKEILKFQEQGASYDDAREMAQAGFVADSMGLLSLAQATHNSLVAQQYALADQITTRGSLNAMIRKGATEEEAAIHLAFARLSAIQNGLSAEQKATRAKSLEQEKQKREMLAEAALLQKINDTVRSNIVMQKLLNGEVNAYTIALANAKAANLDAKQTDLEDLNTATAKNEMILLQVENAKMLNDLAKGYTSEQREILDKYKVIDEFELARITHAEKMNKILKERQKAVDDSRSNPIGNFSNVDFSVFGDFGNPLESALGGVNEYLSKMGELSDKLKTVRQDQLDVAIAAENALVNGGKKSAEYIAATERLEELSKTETDYNKQKKKAQEEAFAKGLSFSKALVNQDSKAYKILSGLEQALQAKKIAFAIWEKKDKLTQLALSLKGYAITTGQFLASTAMKLAAQVGLNAASGVGAVLSAAQQPGPAAFVGFAAMAALVAGLGVAISGGRSSGTFAPTNEGTGTVFGDPTAKSESIKKSIDLLAENSDVTLPLTAAMLKSLQNIENNIGGLANLLIRNAPASKLVEGVNAGFVQNSIGSGITKGVDILNKMTFGLADTLSLGLFSGIGKFLGGLFGKKVSIKGQGLFGGSQQLADVVGNGFNLQEYVDVQTKKKTFGITTSKKNSTNYSAASQELEDQFTLIFGSFNKAILSTAPMLGKSYNEITRKLNSFVINIGKIDLKGLNGEQIQEKLNAVFSAEADRMAQAAMGGLEAFQKVGEGYFETLVRVATSVEMASAYTDRLNVSAIKYTSIINKQGDVTTEIIRQSVLLNEGNKKIRNGFYDLVNTFNGTASEITDFVLTLRDLQDAVRATGKNGDYLTSAMFTGAGGLDRLQGGLESYFELLTPAEQAAELTRRLSKEFAAFGRRVPASVDAFKALVGGININTEAGQKLYGRVIALTPEFMELQDSLKKAEDAAKAKAEAAKAEAEKTKAAAEEAKRLAEQAAEAAKSLAKLRTAFFITGQHVSRLTQVMIDAAGGVDAMQRGLDAMFQMLSPTEKAAELTRRMTIQFKALGLELPSSTDAFRALVKGMNTSTNAGKALLGKVIALAPEFNELQQALNSANTEVNQLVQSLRDLAEQARQARGETEQPRNLDYARAMFESTAMLAMQGDTEAAGKLMSLGTNLMELSKQYSVDGSEYARDLAWIQRAATVAADTQEKGLGYVSNTLSTSLSGGSVSPTLSTTSTSTDAKIEALRGDLNAALLAIAKYTQSTANKLENWDDGNRMMVGVIQEAGDPKVPVTTA